MPSLIQAISISISPVVGRMRPTGPLIWWERTKDCPVVPFVKCGSVAFPSSVPFLRPQSETLASAGSWLWQNLVLVSRYGLRLWLGFCGPWGFSFPHFPSGWASALRNLAISQVSSPTYDVGADVATALVIPCDYTDYGVPLRSLVGTILQVENSRPFPLSFRAGLAPPGIHCDAVLPGEMLRTVRVG